MLSNYRNKTSFQITIHALIWLMLLLFPYLFSNSDSFDVVKYLKSTWVPMFFYAIIFYMNYLSLIDRFLFKQRLFLFLLSNLCLIIVFIWMHIEIRDFLAVAYEIKLPSDINKPSRPIQLFIYKDLLSMIIPIIISFALKTNEKWSKTESEKNRSEKEVLKSELQHLKYQLQPHFFFNSLNTIYSLIGQSPELARETVHNLSKLMRYMLYDAEVGKVKLSDEIAFMKQYINIMKLRISDRTTVQINFKNLNQEYFITPLLFISLIENAFKHGVSSTQASGIVFILNVDKNTIHFISKNRNFPKDEKDKSGSGIGLNNLKKQLEISYPEKHIFKTKIEDDLFIASLELTMD